MKTKVLADFQISIIVPLTINVQGHIKWVIKLRPSCRETLLLQAFSCEFCSYLEFALAIPWDSEAGATAIYSENME